MRRTLILTAVVAVGAFTALAVAAPRNGGFESNNFKGWKTKSSSNESGRWYVYKRGETEEEVRGGLPIRQGIPKPGGRLQRPPEGRFAAIVLQGSPGARFLHRDLKLKANREIKLSMKVFYENSTNRFHTPNNFRFGGGIAPPRAGMGPEPNQQYRIDILKASAPLKSLKAKHLLEELFITRKNAKSKRKPFTVKADLSRYAGRKVTLRLVEVDNQGILHAGVDAVKLTQTPKG